MLRALFPEYLSQDRRVARVFDLKVDSVANVIEKGFEAGVTIALDGLIVPSVSRVRKERISSGVMDSRSLLPNSSLKRLNKNA